MNHHIDEQVWNHQGSSPYYHEQEEHRDWTGTIALVLVILVIVALIIVLVIWRRGEINEITGAFTWNLVQGSATGTTDTFVAEGGNMYVANNSSPLTLTITPPPSPVGKEFAIMNDTGSTLTISEINRVITDGVIGFVWMTPTTYSSIYQT